MDEEPSVVNIDGDQSTHQYIPTGLIDAVAAAAPAHADQVALRTAMRVRVDPRLWTMDTAVEVSDDEMDALIEAAVAHGASRSDVEFLLDPFLAESAPVDVPKLRLAIAFLLTSDEFSSICLKVMDDPAHYREILPARFDWATVAEANDRRVAEAEEAKRVAEEQAAQRLAELEAEKRRRAAIVEEAKRCWNGCLPPTSDEVREIMVAKRRERRQEQERRLLGPNNEPADELDVRIAMAAQDYNPGRKDINGYLYHGYMSYDDDAPNFGVTKQTYFDLVAQRTERRRQEYKAKCEAFLAGEAFADDDDRDAPLLDFFDEKGLLPDHDADGAIMEVIGPAQNYKTTMVVRQCCEALARNPKVTVLYFAGERHKHIRRLLDAYGAELGLTEEDIRKRFIVHNGLPPLRQSENADFLLEAAEKADASIVVLDTWARAIAGMNENTNEPGDLLTETGAIGRIKTLGALVIIIGHCPLTEEKRLRGTSSANDNADARLWIVGTSGKGFKIEVMDMKPLLGDYFVYATVPPLASNLTPLERAALPPPVITGAARQSIGKRCTTRASGPGPRLRRRMKHQHRWIVPAATSSRSLHRLLS